MNQNYEPEFKRKIVRLHLEEGISLKGLAAEYGISKAGISNWTKQFREECQILSEKLGERFIILPSSIHKCIAIKHTDNVAGLLDIVTSINANIVNTEDQLSNHIYLCNQNGLSLLQ